MAEPAGWPKIALVTPVFNSAKYLEATIQSVLNQNYPNLEYVIVDGGSTDGSLQIIRKYEPHLHAWVSEPDHGMYDAINKGFTRTTGEVMGWLNASDALHVGALKVVGSVFATFPEVEWITGRPTILHRRNDRGGFKLETLVALPVSGRSESIYPTRVDDVAAEFVGAVGEPHRYLVGRSK
jgi:glycosyltransferase involved in cell wall biosynthesis